MRSLIAGLPLILLLSSFAQAQPVEPAPPSEPEPEPAPAEVDPQAKDKDRIRKILKDGRDEIKAERFAAGIALIQRAAAEAEKAGLSAGFQAVVHYYWGRALHKSGDDEGAEREIRRARALDPQDPDNAYELAQCLERNERYAEAVTEARAALALGATGEDADDMRALIKDARSEQLHDRLVVIASADYGYDSNILQGAQLQTIANHLTRATSAQQRGQLVGQRPVPELDFTSAALYTNLVKQDFATPQTSTSQWGLPLDLDLDLHGRPVGSKRLGMYLGYHFNATFITYAQQDPNNPIFAQLPPVDSYNIQEHTLAAGLTSQAWRWLDLRLYAEGQVQFTGLSQFSPYLYGFGGVLDVTFIESRRWRTRVYDEYMYLRAFDQTPPVTCTDTLPRTCSQGGDGYLNDNKNTLRILQELRTRYVRPQLGYQLTYDTTGTLVVLAPLQATLKMGGPTQVGEYLYSAPLGYTGNQIFARAKVYLPLNFKLRGSVSYEYQSYHDPYRVSYYNQLQQYNRVPVADLKDVPLFNVERHDNIISFEAAASKELPHGFNLEIAYSFLDDMSNIVNALDNRSYTKQTVKLGVTYLF